MNGFQRMIEKIGGADKVLHFETCLLIVMLACLTCVNVGMDIHLASFLGFMLAAVLGVGKEVYDQKTYGVFDWNDIKADWCGMVAGLVIVSLLIG